MYNYKVYSLKVFWTPDRQTGKQMSAIWADSAMIKIALSSSEDTEEGVTNSIWCFQEITEEPALNWNLKREEESPRWTRE